MMQAFFITAPWCPTCNALKPYVTAIQQVYPLNIVDIETEPEYVQKYGIKSVPTLILDHGEYHQVIANPSPKDIKDILSD